MKIFKNLFLFFLFPLAVAAQSAPDLICADPTDDNGVKLTFSYNCDTLNLFVSQNLNGPYSKFGDIWGGGQTSFIHGNAVPGTAYYYYISCKSNPNLTSDTLGGILPPPPVIRYVTVLEDNSVKVVWDTVIDTAVNQYTIGLYKIDAAGNPETEKFDTIYGRYNTQYIDTIHNPSDNSISYTMASKVDCHQGEGLESEIPHKTIYLTPITVDACTKNLNLSWTRYINWPGTVNYQVFVKANNGNYQATGGQQTDTAYNYSGFQNGDNLTFKIEAYNQRGDTSASNRQEILIDFVPVADTLYLTKVNVNVDKDLIELAWQHSDSNTTASQYKIYRKTGGSAFKLIGSTAKTTYIDKEAATRFNAYTYKITATDPCDNIQESNEGKSILLEFTLQPDFINLLEWNSYELNLGENPTYKLYRSIDGSTRELIQTFATSPGSYEDDVFTVANNDVYDNPDAEDIFKYFVSAEYSLNIEGQILTHTVFSNPAEKPRPPRRFIPNAFDPTSAKVENRIFAPLFAFEKEYRLLIFNRWGDKIFEQANQGWDGICGGDYCPAGVYVYKLSYTGADGKEKEPVKGTVTLIRSY